MRRSILIASERRLSEASDWKNGATEATEETEEVRSTNSAFASPRDARREDPRDPDSQAHLPAATLANPDLADPRLGRPKAGPTRMRRGGGAFQPVPCPKSMAPVPWPVPFPPLSPLLRY